MALAIRGDPRHPCNPCSIVLIIAQNRDFLIFPGIRNCCIVFQPQSTQRVQSGATFLCVLCALCGFSIPKEIGNDIIIRIDPKTKEIVAFTILNFETRFEHKWQRHKKTIKRKK